VKDVTQPHGLALRDATVAVGTAIPRRIPCRGCGP